VRFVTAAIQIDADDVGLGATSADTSAFRESVARERHLADVQVALGVDRPDYTTGVPECLDALECLLADHPNLRGAVTLVQKGAETRSQIHPYRELQNKIRACVRVLIDCFGTEDWQPIVFTTDDLHRRELAALSRNADVALVSPVRDGLNLVAKEFVAAQCEDPSALVLSDSADVATELAACVLTVRPLATGSFAETLRRAIRMPASERRDRLTTFAEAVGVTDSTDGIATVFEPIATDPWDADSPTDEADAVGD
jgi:trehalose 6-phosphate synthase